VQAEHVIALLVFVAQIVAWIVKFLRKASPGTPAPVPDDAIQQRREAARARLREVLQELGIEQPAREDASDEASDEGGSEDAVDYDEQVSEAEGSYDEHPPEWRRVVLAPLVVEERAYVSDDATTVRDAMILSEVLRRRA
jgi:hypothetical protein